MFAAEHQRPCTGDLRVGTGSVPRGGSREPGVSVLETNREPETWRVPASETANARAAIIVIKLYRRQSEKC
jgi:hypothetical protein